MRNHIPNKVNKKDLHTASKVFHRIIVIYKFLSFLPFHFPLRCLQTKQTFTNNTDELSSRNFTQSLHHSSSSLFETGIIVASRNYWEFFEISMHFSILSSFWKQLVKIIISMHPGGRDNGSFLLKNTPLKWRDLSTSLCKCLGFL